MAPPVNTPRDIPAVSPTVDAAVREPLSRVREEVQRLLGFVGVDKLDKAITWRQAIAQGWAASVPGGTGFGGGGGGGTGGGGTGGPIDLTPPPLPTNFDVSAGFSSLVLKWDPPIYTQGHGHGQTNVYGVQRKVGDTDPPPVFGDAALVSTAYGKTTITSLSSELNTRWHLWIKWQSVDGVEGPAAGGTNGVMVETGQDISQLLALLTGNISASLLDTALSATVDLITAGIGTPGSVNARVKTETDARVAAILAEEGARITGDATTLAGAQTYTQTWAYSKSTVDSAIAAMGSSVTSAFTVADGLVLADAQAYVGTYAYSKAAVDSAFSALDTTLRAAFAAADVTTLASANAFTYSRATIDSAIASSASTLTTNFTNGDISTLAAAQAYTYSQSTIDASIASSASTLTAAYGSAISAAVAVESSARAALDGSVHALYTLRVQTTADGRTVVGGFGLAATSTVGGGSEITFGVRADRFYVGAPSSATGVGDILPFVIQTTPTTINGVAVPIGVWMDAAFILRGSITNAQIGNATIDDAKITSLSVAKLIAGELQVGSYIRSTGYTGSGSNEFELTASGNLRATSAVLSGTITASAGAIGGITIGSTAIYNSGFVAGTSGFRIHSDGTAEFNSIFARGNIQANSLIVGSSPAVSGTTMTGTGGVINSGGTFALGNSTTNINFNGTTLTLNGAVVTAANLNLGALSVSISPSSVSTTATTSGSTGHGTVTATASGGTAPYSYIWSVASQYNDPSGSTGSAFVTGTSGTGNATCGLGTVDQSDNSRIEASFRCVVIDANGRSVAAELPFQCTRGTAP